MTKNLIMIVGFVAVLMGALFVFGQRENEATDQAPAAKAEFIPLDSDRKTGKALFSIYGSRPKAPDHVFQDEQGNSLTLQDFKGQNLLVNFWATWCVPCRVEMPELDKLQMARGNEQFKVVIISVDRGGLTASRKFLDDVGIKNLDLYYDEKGVLARKMKTIGYPTTVLINSRGQQFGILTGPAHWNSEGAHKLIDRLIAD